MDSYSVHWLCVDEIPLSETALRSKSHTRRETAGGFRSTSNLQDLVFSRFIVAQVGLVTKLLQSINKLEALYLISDLNYLVPVLVEGGMALPI